VVTHQMQVERRTGKVRRSKTNVLPTVPRNQPRNRTGVPEAKVPTMKQSLPGFFNLDYKPQINF